MCLFLTHPLAFLLIDYRKKVLFICHLLKAHSEVGYVSHFSTDLFCLLNDVEQKRERREVCLLVMHIYEHFVAEGAEVFADGFKDSTHLVIAFKVERAEVVSHLLHCLFCALAQSEIALTFLLTDGRKVVIYMVKRRFGEAHKAVENLAQRVVDKVEVCREAHCPGNFRAAEANRFATAEVFTLALCEAERLRCLAQRAEVFCEKSFSRVA